MWLLVTILVCSGLLSAALFGCALWGRAVGRTIYCRRCGYDLTGVWPPEPWKRSRCTECGGTLWLVNAVTEGDRPRRRRLLGVASAFAAVAALSGAVIAWSLFTGFDWHTVEPESMLLRQAQSAGGLETAASLMELTTRASKQRLSDDGLRGLAVWAIERGSDKDWLPSMPLTRCDIVEAAWAKGLLEREQKGAYVRQMLIVSLGRAGKRRIVTDAGDMVPLRLACMARARGAQPVELIVRGRVRSASLKGMALGTEAPAEMAARLGPGRYESGGEVLVEAPALMEIGECRIDAHVDLEVFEGTNGSVSPAGLSRPISEGELGPERLIASWTEEVSTPLFSYTRSGASALVRQGRYREGVAAAIASPSIGAGISDGGRVFFVMQFKPANCPIWMCFDAFLRFSDEELVGEQDLCIRPSIDEQSCTVTFGATGIGIPTSVDVVLRPSVPAAGRANAGDIWGEEVVIKGVRVDTFGGAAKK